MSGIVEKSQLRRCPISRLLLPIPQAFAARVVISWGNPGKC
jgi:hypothetical protein